MPVSPELLEILVCPESRQPIAVAPKDLLARLNGEIESGSLRNRGGKPVTTPIGEGLLREDGTILYIVDDGIPVMLASEARQLD